MADTRDLLIRLIGDDDQLNRVFKRASANSAKFSKSVEANLGTRAGGVAASFETLGAKLRGNPLLAGATGGAAAFGAAEIGEQLRKSIGLASSLGEALSKNDRLFGDSAKVIADWSETTASSIGIARLEAVTAAGDFGGLFRTLGLGSGVAASMSTELVKLAADLASFNNTDPADALAALRSGLVGESEPLRRYQVLLSEARVQQEAYADGIAKSGAKLTEEQKVLARYQLILKDTTQAQGDFARTSGGLANQSRVLTAQLTDLETSLGRLAVPVLTNVVTNLNAAIVGAGKLGRALQDLKDKIPDPGGKFGQFFHILGEIGKRTNPITGSFQLWADAINAVGLNADKATPKVGSLIDQAEAFRRVIGFQANGENIFSDPFASPAPPVFSPGPFTPFDQQGGLDAFIAAVTGAPDAIQKAIDAAQSKFDAAQAAVDKQRASFENLMARLALRFDTAAATNNLRGELAALEAQEKVLRAQVAVEGHTVDLDRRLFELQQQRIQIQNERTQRQQFRALGLNDDGSTRLPGVKALRSRLASIEERIKGTPLDTAATRAKLERIAKVLSGQYGKVGDEVARAILGMFDKITGALKKGGDDGLGKLTKTTSLNSNRIVEGLGLSRDEERALRARLSRFNSAGQALARGSQPTFGIGSGATVGAGGGLVVQSYVTVEIDGEVAGRAVTRSQTKTGRGTRQKRGPNRRIGGV